MSRKPAAAEVVAHVKRQLIGADAQRLAGDQRGVGAAVGIGDGFLESERALSPISCKAILTPGAGRPDTVSSTWVESRPVVTGTPGPSTSATRRSRVIRPISCSAASRSASASCSSRRANWRRIESRVWRRTQTMNGKPNFSR